MCSAFPGGDLMKIEQGGDREHDQGRSLVLHRNRDAFPDVILE
jgi:hypothetical protein